VKTNNLLKTAGLLILTVVLMEALLRLFTPFPIHTRRANRVMDPHLIYRLSPHLKDTDKNGFRNPVALEKADIVVLGDSHTFGYNVALGKSWPQLLGGMTNKTVYNFGMPGYGSLQYYYLVDDAIKLQPEFVILGLFLANDLNDVCKTIIKLPYWDAWAKEYDYDTSACFGSGKPVRPWQEGEARPPHLIENTAIGSLASYVWKLAADRINPEAGGEALYIDDVRNPTIMTYENINQLGKFMDTGRDKIDLCYRITRDVILAAKNKLDASNIKFGVVFIPSKERAYFDYLKARGFRFPDGYHLLVNNEKNLVDRFSSFFDEHSIPHVDAKPYVLRKLINSENVYLHSTNDHPFEPGYLAYAEAAFEGFFSSGESKDTSP
jgi:hypothetical protein